MRSGRLAVLFGVAVLAAIAGCGSSDAANDDSETVTGSDALSGSLAAGAALVTTTNVNLRSAPVISNNVIELLNKGTVLAAVGGGAQNGFYAVRHGGTSGYVSANYIAPSGAMTDAGAADVAPPSGGSFSVTFIGDSHSDFEGNARGAFGFLGQHLKELMAGGGVPFSLYGASGSVPTWWFDDTSTQAATWGYTQTSSSPPRRTCSRGAQSGACVPKLSAILDVHPSLFVIEQGTNLLGRGSASVADDIQKMLSQIAGKAGACLWVGAPNARTSVHSQQSQDQLWSLIRQHASASCFTYDSRFLPRTDGAGQPVIDAQGNLVVDVPLPYSPDANDDGEHLGMTAAGKWAEGLMQMIAFIRAHPR